MSVSMVRNENIIIFDAESCSSPNFLQIKDFGAIYFGGPPMGMPLVAYAQA